jgi:hypothetical protein
MKIKPLIALTAFAASMSAFAQPLPAPAAGHHEAGHRTPLTAESRETLRKDVHEFHGGQQGHALPPVTADARPHGPEAHPAVLPGVSRREQVEHRKHVHAQRQDWAERREALQAHREARAHRREARHARMHAAHQPGAMNVAPVTSIVR